VADYDLLKDIIKSRQEKVARVSGDASRYEDPRLKAQRLGDAPYYQNPNTRPEDRHAPQRLGDDYNLQANQKQYLDDVPGNEWMRSPNESAERKPGGSEGQNPGRGFVGSERQAAHRVGRPHGYDITKNPAEAGYGARDRTGNPATQSKMVREGRKPRDGDSY
jgi:hypothetical protein